MNFKKRVKRRKKKSKEEGRGWERNEGRKIGIGDIKERKKKRKKKKSCPSQLGVSACCRSVP